MKLNRIAVAVALAMAGGSALGQQAAAPVTEETSVQLYGHLDLSIDDITKGISGRSRVVGAPGSFSPSGKNGYQDDISSNLSFVGVRGSHPLGSGGLRAVFQAETQLDVASTPGVGIPDGSVKGAWSSRNSFVGLAGGWGAFKVGKTDAPYKLSTARMDPFASSIGDYNSIMGNTGGDNRAEFDTRLSHAMWYESPSMGGFRVNALYAPGQNRSTDNINTASGEPNCTGGNPPPCNDGSFGNAYSIAGIYEAGPVYLIAAYEKHKNVNRTGDDASGGGPAPAGAVGVGDEQAWKAGVQYQLPTSTTVDFILERMTRSKSVSDFNERQRSGFWLAATQKVSGNDDVNIGWAHAGKTPGTPDGPLDNKSNMLALGYKHHFDRQTNWYAVFARQNNADGAHYDLGASGHGITTDCKDETGACFTGGKLQGISVGMQYNF